MTSLTILDGTGLCHLPSPFPLAHGGALAHGHVAFECHGPADAPAVAVLGGISADRHVAPHADDPRPGWWAPLVGPGRAIDTRRFRVVSIDWLGGAGASSSPDDGCAVDVRDQARALAAALDSLGIARLRALCGASYGGMVGLAFACEFGERVARLCAIAAADRSHALATAWRSVQRRIVRFGQGLSAGRDALALARALALTTYRSATGLAARFAAPPQHDGARFRFAVEGWLEARGADFAARFSPDAFVRLSESIDLCRIDPRAVRAPVTLVGTPSDQLVPLAQLRELAAALPGPALLVELDSVYGHDAFLKEADRLAPILAEALEEVRP
jgi:homoserine O-acetyltransferase